MENKPLKAKEDNIKGQFISSTKWSGISAVIMCSIQVVQVIILGRLLSPSDFGLMGMVMVVVGLANVFVDMGVSNALICKQDQDEYKLSSIYWISITAGILVQLVFYIISPLIVKFYREPGLLELMFWIGSIFPITSIGQQYKILFERDLEFKLLSRVEIITTIFGFVLTVASAYLRFGVYSFIIGQVGSATLKSILLFSMGKKRWPIRMHFKIEDVKGYISFGLYQIGERLVNYFNANLDYIMIGFFMGAQALGYYTFAYNLIVLPMRKVNPIITRVAFPIMARIQNDTEKLKNIYLNLLKLLSFINFPILFGMAATANHAITIIFGSQWNESILLIKILAFVGILKVVGNPIGVLLLSKGRADIGFFWNVFVLITQLPGIYLGIHLGGSEGVAIAYLILEVFQTIAFYPAIIRLFFKNCLREYINSILSSLCFGIIMYLNVVAAGILLGDLEGVYVFTIQVILGILVYMILVYKYEWNTIKEILPLSNNK